MSDIENGDLENVMLVSRGIISPERYSFPFEMGHSFILTEGRKIVRYQNIWGLDWFIFLLMKFDDLHVQQTVKKDLASAS